VAVVVHQPVGKHLLVYLVGQYLALQVVAILGNARLVLLVQLHLQLSLHVSVLPLVVPLESHPVEVQSLTRREIDIETLLLEGLLNGLLALESLITDLDE
jgi:hypothetical protein